jgi:hypothetical protein
MKKRIYGWVVLGLFLSVSVLYAQEPDDVVRVVGNLLKDGQIELAGQRVDDYLIRHPADVDGLMMKGVVVLNERLASASADLAYTDDSIYHPANGLNQKVPYIIPQTVATEVAGYWNQGLSYDNTRADLHQSLCFLYAQALMKPELVAELATMKTVCPDDGELKYRMGEFARMVADRNRLDDALEVFQTIIGVYPDDPLIYAELARTLLENGRIVEAKNLLTTASALLNPGQAVFQTLFLADVISGDYEGALHAAQSLASLIRTRDWRFYKGVWLYYQNDPRWLTEMRGFLTAPADQANQENRDIARFLVSKTNKNDFPAYLKVISMKKIDAYTLLLHKRAMDKFPNQAEPFLQYAEYQNYYHNYPESLKVYQYLESRRMITPALAERTYLHYAWALQDSGDRDAANKRWLHLFNAKDFYTRSAAIYFFGKNLLESENKSEALKFFQMIAPDAAKSKYAFFSQRLVGRMIQGSEPVDGAKDGTKQVSLGGE